MITKITQPGDKKLRTTAELSAEMKASFSKIMEAKKAGRPLTWLFGLLPLDLWNALELPVITMEQISQAAAAKQLSAQYLEVAEEAGFSRDICSYPRIFIGCALSASGGKIDPWLETHFALPDLMVGANYPCISESKSFIYLADRLGIPYYQIDAPVNSWGDKVPDYAIDYYAEQMKGLLSFLEAYGCRVEWERLKNGIALSRRLLELDKEVSAYRKESPTPMGCRDGMTWTYNTRILVGTETAVRLHEKLRDEVRERFEKKIGIIDNERLRLLWLTTPPIFDLSLFNYPEQYGAVAVKTIIPECIDEGFDPEVMDPDKPLESLARKHLASPNHPLYGNMVQFVVKQVEEYKIDGMIMVNERGCRWTPAGLKLYKDAVMEKCGVPSIILDLDCLDLREYDQASVRANLDVFIEMLRSRRRESAS